MRAAEDEGVDAGRRDRVEVVVGDAEQLVAAGDARLDELDEPRAGLRVITVICGAAANASS